MIFNVSADQPPEFQCTLADAVFAFVGTNKFLDSDARVSVHRRVNLDSTAFQGFEWAVTDSANNGHRVQFRSLDESVIERGFKKEWDDNWLESLSFFRELEFFDSPAEAAGDFAERYQAVYGCQEISGLEVSVVRHRNCEQYAVVLSAGDEEETAHDYEIGCRFRDAGRAHRWFWGALNDGEFFYQSKPLMSWKWNTSRNVDFTL
ncbi:hypothetical protein AAKU67_004459 [Oxalobacteraceae bacterium GrIS 2.11]